MSHNSKSTMEFVVESCMSYLVTCPRVVAVSRQFMSGQAETDTCITWII